MQIECVWFKVQGKSLGQLQGSHGALFYKAQLLPGRLLGATFQTLVIVADGKTLLNCT